MQMGLLLAENCYAIRQVIVGLHAEQITLAIGRKEARTCATKNFPWMSHGDSGRIALGIMQEQLTDEPTNRSATSFALFRSLASDSSRVKREIPISRTNRFF